MKWIKSFESLPESEDKHEACFSLQEMKQIATDFHYKGYGRRRLTVNDLDEYFMEKFGIQINDM